MAILRLRDENGNVFSVPAIKGERGEDGTSIKSIARTKGTGAAGTTDTYTITLTDGSTFDFEVYNGADGTMTFSDLTDEQKASMQGADGEDGEDGQDGVGIASVEQTTTSTEDGGENVITVTLTDGNTFTFKVKNGSKGSKGETGAAGSDGADGYTPVKGTDYFTDEDKAEIVSLVLANFTDVSEVGA